MKSQRTKLQDSHSRSRRRYSPDFRANSSSFSAAHPAIWAGQDTFQGGSICRTFSAFSLLPAASQPSRSPAWHTSS